jgi:hypothetical protein
MKYSLNPADVRRVLDAKLQGRPYDQQHFLFYHLHRNLLNVKLEVTNLRRISPDSYVDNLGNTWAVQSNLANFFHMPTSNWMGSIVGISTPYSRKFLRDDTVSGLDGEFEMIIRSDGERIDTLTHAGYQGTYNFGSTRDMRAHKTLDVDPHWQHSHYTFRQDMGRVIIIEKEGK